MQHIGNDGQAVDYVSVPLSIYPPAVHAHAHSQYMEYNAMDQPPPHHMYSHLSHVSEPQYHPHTHYQDYEHYPASYGNADPFSGSSSGYIGYPVGDRPTTPPSPSEHSGAPSPLPLTQQPGTGGFLSSGYDELPDHYRVTPSPGGPINLDHYTDEPAVVYGYVSPSPYSSSAGHVPGPTYDTRTYEDSLNGPLSVSGPMRSLFEEDDLQKHMNKMTMSLHGHNLTVSHTRTHGMTSPTSAVGDDDQRGMRWRDPNLTEVIGFLNNPNNVIKANAAAYLQHLCYMDDPNKQKTRALGGIPPLVKLLSHESPDVFRNACGALRNLSYGRQNDENKRAIKNAGGIPALINLLRKSSESEVKELVTGVIWNMSSCEDLKRAIIDDGVVIVVTNIIIPHSGWDFQGNSGETCWSTVFRNASGVLRNVSSAGEYARKKLRECDGLIDALLYVVRCAIEKSNIGNKVVENCVCILRNLSYRCQEVEDPNYDRNPLPTQSRVTANTKGKN